MHYRMIFQPFYIAWTEEKKTLFPSTMPQHCTYSRVFLSFLS